MKITKLGHCCLIIEINDVRILTDPGAYSTAQNDVKDIDLILITHEHQDHLHLESLKTVLQNNPDAKVFTNTSVGKILSTESIEFEILEHGQGQTYENVLIEGFGNEHAEIYGDFSRVQNTGYFIDNKFFYPGDALTNPGKEVEILALPVAGPWIKMMECLNYAKEVRPKICFPVHDGFFREDRYGPFHFLPEHFLTPENIEFKVLALQEQIEFDQQ